MGACMKNVYEVLRQKELEISQLKKEVEALRVAAPLLSEDNDSGDENKPRLASSTVPQRVGRSLPLRYWRAKRSKGSLG